MSLLAPLAVALAAAAGSTEGPSEGMHLRLNLLSAGAGDLETRHTHPMLDVADGADSPVLTWELPGDIMTQTRASIAVDRVPRSSAPVYAHAVVGIDQNATLLLAGLVDAAALYTATVTTTGLDHSGAQVVRTSIPLKFFTGLREWEAKPIWAAPCAAGTRQSPPYHNNTTPQYAWFRSSLALPAHEEIVSALAFVSAEAPLSVESAENTEKWGLDRGSKILGGYKLFVGNRAVGVGPGRPRCAVVSQGACEKQTPYDGFALRVPAGATDLEVEIHAYGRDQPTINLTQRVILQLVVRTKSGTVLQLGTSDKWEAFDADCSACSLYRPTGNSGGRFGAGYWYFYPHENMNASCLPGENRWPEQPVIKPQFLAPLRAKPVSAIAIETVLVDTPRKIAPGHFSFALVTEVQGGLQLSLSASHAVFAGAQAQVLLSEQLNADGSVKVPMYTGATYESNFSLAPGAKLEHHEYSNWRFGEVIFTDSLNNPLDVGPAEFNLTAWAAHYPWDSQRATSFHSSSPPLNQVWGLNQNSVKYLGLDMYSDSNARQRSDACQADAATASQAQFATSSELAMPRYQMEMIMDFTHVIGPNSTLPNPSGTGGFVNANWADWTVLPAINVVNDALFTGDLRPGNRYFDDLVMWHLYQDMIDSSGLVVDSSCGNRTGSCLSCLIDTSGGSDDGFQQSHANSIVQAWVYYGMREVARLGRWIGRADAASKLDAAADAMKAAFNRLMIDKTSGAVCDGLCTDVPHASLHSSFYALAFGIVDEPHKLRVFDYLKQRIEASPVGYPGGSYPVQFLLVALYNVEADRGHLAYNVSAPQHKSSHFVRSIR